VLADGQAWRVYSIAVDDDGSMLHVGQTLDDRRLQQLRVAVVSLGAALGVGLVAAVWLSRRVRIELEPLVRLSEAVRRLDPLAAASLPPATRDELVPLRDAVIELGERLSRMLANERAFIAHAAHTLRTPLAGMDAQLAAAMQECPPQSLPRLQRTRDALARLNRVVLALLNMFRSGTDLNLQPVELSALLARLPFEGLTLTVVQQVPLLADPDLMTAALLNLLENASRHGARQVTLEVLAVGADVLLRIQDDGSGFEVERLPVMQQAIDSQDYARGKGLGLGLTLADLVARAHGGRLRLLAGPAGATVEIVLRHLGQAAGRGPARIQTASASMSSARDAPMKAGDTSASITSVGMPRR
jgi:signal transduction histidine kinase